MWVGSFEVRKRGQCFEELKIGQTIGFGRRVAGILVVEGPPWIGGALRFESAVVGCLWWGGGLVRCRGSGG
ncbi:hypothetical protein RchiOBHm_Chr5g0056111 [Rosa chinensis]|uniref:Uncharacterized protein n=1 Tax=Rosa chinensis TaxID=74649 RepID=A0A2P6QGK3_ROSCH|nr:hypothetical protein RchiOBHm_Chr5g0056111 [Rosa chinensis]